MGIAAPPCKSRHGNLTASCRHIEKRHHGIFLGFKTEVLVISCCHKFGNIWSFVIMILITCFLINFGQIFLEKFAKEFSEKRAGGGVRAV